MDKHSFEIWSPQFRNRRGVDVYLPESYPEGRFRYPVVYMQDGQNLSDPSIAFGGNTWRLGDGLPWLAERRIEPIIVAPMPAAYVAIAACNRASRASFVAGAVSSGRSAAGVPGRLL